LHILSDRTANSGGVQTTYSIVRRCVCPAGKNRQFSVESNQFCHTSTALARPMHNTTQQWRRRGSKKRFFTVLAFKNIF